MLIPMAAMDLSTKQEVMGVQNRYEYAHHIYIPTETFEETDIQGNINLFSTLKTDANSTHDHDSSSLLQVSCPNENKFEVDNDLFSYSSFKKAMDLRTHNRTLDGVRRTIFDDAEYFARNYRYKLLPITLEPVDETVIQFEHNYSLMSLNSESETDENFSRTMDYSQIKEKNYKRRRTKFRDGSDVNEEVIECEVFDTATNGFHSSPILQVDDESLTAEEEQNASLDMEIDDSVAVQPLDLSAAPLVQEQKTDLHLRESPSSIVENEEVAQLDSDKENVNSEMTGILVTITRPDVKGKYQPCDLFLNDIATIVPGLIGKDCFEVDLLDRTCDPHEFRKHRLYYVISESTWRLFQKTNERVILTNDQSLGQPIRKAEEDEKPCFLIFDQFSLAKCLADYCQEIGGCFEYTCVEEGEQEAYFRAEGEQEAYFRAEGEQEAYFRAEGEQEAYFRAEGEQDACFRAEGEQEAYFRAEGEQEAYFRAEGEQDACFRAEGEQEASLREEGEEETAERVVEMETEEVDEEVVDEEKEVVDVSQKEPEEEKVEEVSQERNDITDLVETAPEELTEKVEEAKQDSSELDDASQKETTHPKEEKATEEVVPPPEPEENAPEKADETKQKPPDQKKLTNNKQKETPKQVNSEPAVSKGKNNTKKQSRGTKRKRKSSIQRKPKISRTTLRLRSAPPEPETSQKSDKPVSRKGRREPTRAKEEPPNKLTKPSVPEVTTVPPVQEEPYRKTRSGKVLQEVKTNKPTAKKKENAGLKKEKKTESKGGGQKTAKVEVQKTAKVEVQKTAKVEVQKTEKVEVQKTEEMGRSLRSHKTTQWKEKVQKKVQVWSKTKARKR